MQVVTTVGLDIAKSVFQVHGVDSAGQVVIRRQLKRRYVLAFFEKLPACLVGIEACASSHHWSRELKALGHTVRLMPPAYVKPYVKRQKNDATDAEAICEAVTRANMRFVATKTWTCPRRHPMSAIEGRADMTIALRNVCFSTQSGHLLVQVATIIRRRRKSARLDASAMIRINGSAMFTNRDYRSLPIATV